MSEKNRISKIKIDGGSRIAPVDASSQLSKGYKGDITSKEAGDIVKKMVHDQEQELIKKYNLK